MSKGKILVVDDEPDFLKVIRLRLEAEDYEVLTAADGEDALEKIKQNQPKAVLLDILMPGIGGLKTLEAIRKQNKELPVFMLTAFCNEERFKEAKDLGASGFIVKANDLKEQIADITGLLRLSSKYKGKETT